ncbi:leucine--tRNA ligase [uncultured Dokdonia sp.]|uniref:leucine--tRNA ligase n=1 Tax=uncultured Dokdonia sp. TaxID=575653 RepID=UPI002633C5EB|nr:leucine--tRNA ligase [uncultured Dokdonia sp.]
MKYHFNEIEAKWQKYWADNGTFHASNTSDKPKYYVLDMFPYPSGAGLHVGHPLGYIASDVYARYKRLKGFNVLHPQGYDSFGLPAEQYAIQTGQHPATTTKVNIEGGVDNQGNVIAGYRNQLDKIGFSFDWSREVRTSDPAYYKWTQWIFTELYNAWYNNDSNKAEGIDTLVSAFAKAGNESINAVCDDDVTIFTADEWNAYTDKEQQAILLKYRLTYLAETEVNWCPALGTVLANDEIVNGVSERGGHPVVRKKMTQWSMRISAYAERLIQGLDTIDWSESIKETQRNWIGKSVGAEVEFKVISNDSEKSHTIPVFTTRPDTIFGVSFMTLAPELELVQEITTPEQKEAVEAYIEATSKRSERERMADVKTISGVFTGAYAEHPFTKEPVPVWIGDYVLAGYGTGAVMAVPCGDQRDYDFAKKFDIPIPNVFEGVDISEEAFADKAATVIANSDFLNGLKYKKAVKLAIYELEKIGAGTGKTNYRLRDAVFSRQRYWGEPFPVYYVDGMPKMIALEHLPVELPAIEKYLPTEDGAPPLGRADVWSWDTTKNEVVSNDLIDGKTVFPLELNTMPGWAGSSWYFIKYMDNTTDDGSVPKEALDYWGNVDLYIGGSEHGTGHLLYSRFWTKFLHDRGYLGIDEPFQKMINQGMILGTSAIAYRISGTNTYVSAGLKDQHKTEGIHIDVNMVNASDEIDVETLKNWQPQFKDAEFILDEGKFVVGREVEKMSKRWYNVVNPDDICNQYGADTLRMYEMFLGPLEQAKPWNTAGISGVHNFLKKLWRLYHSGAEEAFHATDTAPTKENLKTLHKTIKKVEEDIENFSFNTSVSTFMIAGNELATQKCTSRAILEPLLILIAPYAPHIAEELWSKLGHTESISEAPFPIFEEKHLVESSKNYPISFNGKMKFTLELPLDYTKDQIEEVVMAHEKTKQYLGDRTPKKVIIVPGKIVNIVG